MKSDNDFDAILDTATSGIRNERLSVFGRAWPRQRQAS
jgi:hypothetical protein